MPVLVSARIPSTYHSATINKVARAHFRFEYASLPRLLAADKSVGCTAAVSAADLWTILVSDQDHFPGKIRTDITILLDMRVLLFVALV